MMPSISVIMCTKNRAPQLERTLESMTQLVIPDGIGWELVVADNGSVDETPGVIRAASQCLPIRHLSVADGGASRARNAAIEASTGQIILITDDDCLPAADWLAAGYELLRSNPRQMIGGRIELYDKRDLPVALRHGFERERLVTFSKIGGFCLSANLACGRVVIDELGGFDVRLGPGTPTRSNEDADLVYRAFRASIPVIYDPSLVVLHAHGRDTKVKVARLFMAYTTGDGAMAMKYLLRGDLQPVRTLYWDLISMMRTLMRGRGDYAYLWVQAQALRGALHFYRVRRQPAI